MGADCLGGVAVPFGHGIGLSKFGIQTFCPVLCTMRGRGDNRMIVRNWGLALFYMFWALPAWCGDVRNVLFLNSYHSGYTWSDTIMDGARDTILQHRKDIYIQIEFMDTKRFTEKRYFESIYDHYKRKFSGISFDIILASDNAAYEFMIQYGNELFPGVPIVFCGVNDVSPQDVPYRDRITGVLEEFDVVANLQIIRDFFPQRKRLVVIGDRSITGIAIANQVRDGLKRQHIDMEVEFWDEYSLEELLTKVRLYAADSVFFFIPFYKVIGDSVYSAQDLLRIVWQQTRAPIFSAWNFLLGYGIVGGKLLDGYAHGAQAATMMLRILNGESPARIPVVTSLGTDRFRFDYRILQELGIGLSRLPSGSEVINEPPSFYSIDRRQFWTIMVALGVLVVTLVFLVINILERRQAEHRLTEQVAFLGTLMRALPLPIYITDAHRAIHTVNPAFEAWFGGEGKTVVQRPDVLERLVEERFDPYETELPYHDGSARSVVLHKAKAQTAGMGLVGAVHDITARKRAENDLRLAEEKYRGIFENSVLGIFRTTPDGQWLDANPALARMLGYVSPWELLSAHPNIASLYLEEAERQRIVALYQRSRGQVEAEIQFRRRDGEVIVTNLNARAVRLEDGRISHFEGFLEDVTAKKAAERALAASEEMLQLVLNTIPQLVDWKDRNLRFLGANKRFLQFMGLMDITQIRGRTYRDITPNAQWVEVVEELDRQVVEHGVPLYGLRRHTANAAGEEVVLLLSKVPLHDAQGRIVGVLSTAEDVTAVARLERQLLQSQKMEALGTLVGGIAHDFNNILTSIINSTELALEDVSADGLAVRDLQRSLRAAQRGSSLVKQLLAFSRPSREGFEPIDVREIVAECVALVRASMPRTIEIVSHLDEDAPACLADPTGVHQVVMNLLTNAYQAIGTKSGRIDVGVGRRFVGADEAAALGVEEGSFARVWVRDDGPGLAPEIQDKIFDPFFTTKGKGEGTGLGLAVVHGIVRTHRGAIQVRSTPDVATEFEVLLPALGDVCLLEREGVAYDVHGRETVVFVEDDEDQLHIVPRMLRQLGYTVHAFSDARSALAALREGIAAQVVVTDFDMPGMTGVELARALAEEGIDVPVILISGRMQEKNFTFANVRAVVPKPYNREQLAGAIRQSRAGKA
jgi:two-component system cell cycle sensor histidine kinase/response regulator CckA